MDNETEFVIAPRRARKNSYEVQPHCSNDDCYVGGYYGGMRMRRLYFRASDRKFKPIGHICPKCEQVVLDIAAKLS